MNLLSLLVLALGFMSCSDDNNEPGTDITITCSPTEINVEHEEETATIDVKVNREWMVYSNENWITCTPSSSINETGTVTVAISANGFTSKREGSVIVKSGNTRTIVPVSQEAKPEIIAPTIVPPEGYELVWNDEFLEGDRPGNGWSYETGGGGWGNNELQTYVNCSKDGEQLAIVEDGVLNIIAKKIGGTVYSIRMNTVQSWTYGYFEARLKLPAGKGTWPAFWMMPKDFKMWPDDGEIDIMEEVGYDPNVVVSTIHCKAYNHASNTQKTGNKLISTAQTEFHVYALEWTKDFIKGYVDGECYFSFDNDKAGDKNTWPFDVPFYLKLNLAWGGNWGGAQGVDETVLPATYSIDYVRVFQKK